MALPGRPGTRCHAGKHPDHLQTGREAAPGSGSCACSRSP